MSATKQTQYSPQGYFFPFMLILMSTYPPLSTDMYLPALTKIAGELDTNDTTMNLTVVLFFVFYAFSTLLWGPISDKYGRKKSVIAGILCYTLASLVCIVTHNISLLIAARIFQAIGSGAPVTISLAIVQDTYTGERKKRILTALSAIMMIAPVAAPLLGSLILTFADWRIIFVSLTTLGVISLFGCLRLPETNTNMQKDESVIEAMMGVFRVSSNLQFSLLLILFSLLALYVLGFVGGSSLIFMQEFHVTPQMFSVFFGANALFAVIGASLYVPLSKKFSNSTLVSRALYVVTATGALIIFFGHTTPLIFTLCLIPGTLASALLRPVSFDMLLQVGGAETGTVSALINFTFIIIGSIGMQIVALQWDSRVRVYGVMTLITAVVCVGMWMYAAANAKKIVHIQDSSPKTV